MTQNCSSGSNSSTSSCGQLDFNRRASHSIEEKLMVAVRIRPTGRNEGDNRALHAVNEKMVMIDDPDIDKGKRYIPKQYLYDFVFGEDSSQDTVYESTAKRLVQDVLNGYNATVFAYGATGAGKTHTMVGTSSNPGIMVRALNDIFLTSKQQSDKVDFTVTMSYMEIYNENIRDLLNPSTGHLELREDSRGRNVRVSGLTELTTNSTEEVMRLLHRGNKARTIESTSSNATSSRSHALLSVVVKQTQRVTSQDGDQRYRPRVKQGKLFMIDLAGSERAKQTKNKGKRLQEGAHINRSLLALGNCINALSIGAPFVNFRDSKLTRLLKETLNGNCRTVMIAHVSPLKAHLDESKNTLSYADRANKISNKVERNVLDASYLHVTRYRDIISDLKNEISRLRNKMKDDVPLRSDTQQVQKGNFQSLRENIVSTFKEQMRLRRKLMELDSHLLSLNIAAEQQHSVISHWESKNNRVYGTSRDSNSRRIESDYRIDEVDDVDFLEEQLDDEDVVQQAWTELMEIGKEQERYAEMRAVAEKELEACRKRSILLEDDLPSRINSDEERELLALMLRVHELEADKMMLQSERLVKQHELRRRELLLLRYDRQRQISDEIITRQRRMLEDGRMRLPADLQNLYAMYQQEIQAATYIDSSLADTIAFGHKLPPISAESINENFNNEMRIASSSTDSDWDQSPLPPIQEPPDVEKVMGPIVQPLIAPVVLFPPISASSSRKKQDKLRRIASDDSISSTRNNLKTTS